MSRGTKLVSAGLWGLLLLVMGGVLLAKFMWPGVGRPAAKGETQALPVLYPAAQFSMTDQEGKAFASDDLNGRPWIAAFVFTHCAGICPKMTTTMADLQKQLPDPVHLVSFSVDPDRDTPAVLKEYAQTYHADLKRWHFLTAPVEQVYAAAADMKLAARPAQGEQPILHSEKLLLIDGDGNVRGYYNSTDPAALKKLVADADLLAGKLS